MPIWLLNRRSPLFEENKENEGNGWNDKDTDNHETPTDWGEKKEGNNTIPYERFKEVNDRMKQAEAKLQAIEEEKKAKAEEEAIKKWEQDKIIAQKNEEIEAYKKQAEARKVREEQVSKRNEERIEAVSKKFGEQWDSVKNLIEWFTDPFVLSDKISSLESMVVKQTWGQTWWSKVPQGSNMTRKQELMQKLKDTGTLTAKEQNELLNLTSKSD